MFVPAARVQAIRESPSTQAAQRVRDLRAAGRTIVDLTVGEPDFDTPDHVKAAAVAAMDAGLTKYLVRCIPPGAQRANDIVVTCSSLAGPNRCYFTDPQRGFPRLAAAAMNQCSRASAAPRDN